MNSCVDLYQVHNDRIELHLSDIMETIITVIKNATSHETIEKLPRCSNDLINNQIRINQLEVSINNVFEEIKSKVLNELQETIKNIVRKETLSSQKDITLLSQINIHHYMKK